LPHTYNKQAFANGIVVASPLLSLYCSLVIIELAVKDHLAPWPTGHKVIEWLTSLGEPSLAQQLRTALMVLQCTDRSGNQAPVSGDQYPDLRYLRHDSDFAGMTTDTQIQDALDIVNSVNAALRSKGVLR
jgi:hypothetical protein